MRKDTIVVNLFGGPGIGKSTAAAYIFSQLKMKGIDCEYVTEFAKDKVWENNDEVFKNQLYISGKQSFKISRCYGKVDAIITDSPIALGAQYITDNNPYLGDAILFEFNKYNNINIMFYRDVNYVENGRHQTREKAEEIDKNLIEWLTKNEITFNMFHPTEDGYKEIIDFIMNLIVNHHPCF